MPLKLITVFEECE